MVPSTGELAKTPATGGTNAAFEEISLKTPRLSREEEDAGTGVEARRVVVVVEACAGGGAPAADATIGGNAPATTTPDDHGHRAPAPGTDDDKSHPPQNSPPPIYTAFYPPGHYPNHQIPPQICGGNVLYQAPPHHAHYPTAYLGMINSGALNGPAPAYIIQGDRAPVYVVASAGLGYNEAVRRSRNIFKLGLCLLLMPVFLFLFILFFMSPVFSMDKFINHSRI